MDDKVILEPLSLDHVQVLYDLTLTNREYLRKWLPWLDYIKSSSDTEYFIRGATKPDSAPHFVILYHGIICGIAGFHEINAQSRTGSIGYWLGQKYEGNGIISTAVKELLKVGFNKCDLNKIEIRCAEGNLKSRAIPERLGFIYESTLRDCEWLYSKYVNHAIYSMLAAEYNA